MFIAQAEWKAISLAQMCFVIYQRFWNQPLTTEHAYASNLQAENLSQSG